MDTYMVTLCDREGRDQRVIVSAPEGDTPEDIANFFLDPATRGTKGETVLPNARVIGVRKLRIKRPMRGTVMPIVTKAAV